jgi:hypothetical protein
MEWKQHVEEEFTRLGKQSDERVVSQFGRAGDTQHHGQNGTGASGV